MSYRVLRYFENSDETPVLIGHFDTKSLAREAIHDDLYNHKNHGLKHTIEYTEVLLSQAEIDEMFKSYEK